MAKKKIKGIVYGAELPSGPYTAGGAKFFDEANFPEIPDEMFERQPLDLDKIERVERKSLTYWKDARIRLFKNKAAVLAMFIVLFIVVMSIFGPGMNEYAYDQQIEPLRLNNRIPPRVPGLENLGIFDGTRVTELSLDRLSEYKEGEYKILEEFEVPAAEGQVQKRVRIKEYTYIKNGIEDKYYWFGTDDLARDIWTRVWRGTRISLYVGLLAALIDMIIGVTYGAFSGFSGGRTDIIMMRITEVIGGIPWLVVILIFIMIFGNGLLSMSVAIAFSSWIGMARVVRAQFLKLREQEFLLAARTLGTPNHKLIFKHLIPNIVGQIVIMITFSIPGAIFTEAFLAFLGLGIPAPDASLGSVINDSRKFLQFYPSMIFIPSAVISLLMLSINIFANGLRDALDPKMRNS